MPEAATSSSEVPVLRRWLILLSVILATTLYSTTILVVSTILPQMQGTLSATADEISWVMTFNILATAIVTPMSGWLAARFGMRNVMVWTIAGFTVATLMCGIAESLEWLVFWRIAQGALGAPTTPLGQAVMMDAFPRHQHGMAMGIFGFGVVIGPVIGPWLGGIMAETYTWRWAFHAMVPVGVIAVAALWAFLPADESKREVRLDWTGFLALSIALGATQLVLSRGQRLDWFDSPEIIVEIFVAAIAFWIFVAHSLTASKPFLDPRHLLDRNYAIGLVLVTIYGMLNFTPLVLLPPLLRTQAGYPDSLIGIVLAGRGVGGAIGFLMAGYASRLEPRVSMCIGFGMLFAAGVWLMHIDLNVTVGTLAANAALQGLAIGAIWVPLTVVAFSNIKQADLPETTAVYHLLRNLGSSFFISICVAQIVRSTATNYSRMTEMISPYNQQITYPSVLGRWSFESIAGLAQLSKEIGRQSSMIAHLNAFGLYTAACAATLPLILLMRSRKGTAA